MVVSELLHAPRDNAHIGNPEPVAETRMRCSGQDPDIPFALASVQLCHQGTETRAEVADVLLEL
jgi:hypothetical protein